MGVTVTGALGIAIRAMHPSRTTSQRKEAGW